MFITFLFWNLISIIVFFISLTLISITSFFPFRINLRLILGKSKFRKMLYRALDTILRNIGMILLLILITILSLWNLIISMNYFLLYILPGLVILIFSFTNDWYKLQVKLRLIFFMELFLQDDKLIKSKIIENFIQNIKK